MLADILLGCLIQKRQMLLRQPHVIILKPGGDRRFPVRVLKNRELALINTFGHFSTTFLSLGRKLKLIATFNRFHTL